MSNASTETLYRPLRNGHPLALHDDACLHLRAPRYATCRACESACPADAIRVGESTVDLSEDCVRCGRCAAACPMGALAHPGFSVPQLTQEQEKETEKTLSVDCWKVPRKLSPDGAVRVPCLGGLSASRVLQLVAMAGSRPVALLDRGWCAGCSAGGPSAHPAHDSLEQARSLLKEAGSATLPELRSRPLSAGLMPLEIPAPVTEAKLARRGFFSALAASAAVSVDRVKPLAAGSEARKRRGFEREPVPSRERERLLSALALIGKSAGVANPPSVFPRVAVSDACCNHQLCANVCPTGALALMEQDLRTELMFDTALCIGCDECSWICPSGALTVFPQGDGLRSDALPDRPIRLTSFGEKSCSECGQSFTEPEAEDLCPQCRKRHNLAGSAFRSLFGPGR